jgi:hypothetical protein
MPKDLTIVISASASKTINPIIKITAAPTHRGLSEVINSIKFLSEKSFLETMAKTVSAAIARKTIVQRNFVIGN